MAHAVVTTSKGQQKYINPAVPFLTGSASSLLSCVLFQPLEVIKTWQQQPKLELRSRGLVSVAIHIAKTDGVLTLWRGTMPTIYRTVPGSAVYFSLLDGFRTLLNNVSHGWKSAGGPGIDVNLINLVSGGAARGMAGALLNPLTVVKVRKESRLFNYPTTWFALTHIWKTEGIRGLMSGFWASLSRDAPNAGLYVLFYERMKVLLKETDRQQVLPVSSINFASGVVAGFMSTLVTQPFDVIKTRMQLKPSEYPTFRSAITSIFKDRGGAGFFSGLGPRLVRKSFMTALTWTLYEHLFSFTATLVSS